MELKDNFTNRYFKPDLVKTQIDMINQPTANDAWADGLASSAKASNNSASQNLLSGFSSGLKGAENNKRQEKLDPILKMTGELNARSAYLEAQVQEQEESRMKVKQLFSQNSFNIRNFSSANLAQDTNALNEIAPTLLRSYKQMFGDQTIGSYSHTHDGTIFYENNESGKIEGVNIADLIAQAGINPVELWGDDAGEVMGGISSGARKTFQNTQELQRQQLDKGQAGIDNTNAQTELYGSQAGKIENDISNPPISRSDELNQKLNLDILKNRAEKNYKAIEEKITPRIEANENMLGIYEALDQTLENSPDLVGSDWKTRAWRDVAINFGLSPDLDYQKLKSVEFEKMLRPILGAQFGEKEGERILGKFVSLDNNPESLKTFLNQEIPKVARNIIKDKQRTELYNTENHGNLYDSTLHNNLDGEAKKYLLDRKSNNSPPSSSGSQGEGNGFVVMTNQITGEEFDVPQDQVDLFSKNGYR